jgi:hypothetical protein
MLDVHSDSPLEKEQEQYLFTMPERIMLEPKIGRPQYPIWTEEQEGIGSVVGTNGLGPVVEHAANGPYRIFYQEI